MDPIIAEIKGILRDVAKEQKELQVSQKETDKIVQELIVSQKETDKQLKRLSKDIGAMSRKFGSFTEGMAFPSMERILRKTFHLTNISPNPIAHHSNDTLEWDAMGYCNGKTNRVVVVEVKSHFSENNLSQLKRNLDRFRLFYPDHKNKELLCIVACVSYKKKALQLAEQEGLYFAHIHDDLFDLKNTSGFQPTVF